MAYVLVGVVVAAWAAVAVPARATYGARTTADEPQYLLTALSLAEDRDLAIHDELATDRYRPFHRVDLPVQTEPLEDGREVSPHDPLLPVLLAVPMGFGGWVAAKATLAALGGVLAGLLTWVAHRRLGVGLGVAAGTVLAFGVTAPLSAYATQVYPELPAALAVVVALAALTSPAAAGGPSGRAVLVLGVAATALPWLGVKYVPVAAALVAAGLVRLGRAGRWRPAAALVGGLAAAGAVYLLAHQVLYGGWTVYAAGDHFIGGEITVMGEDPNYLARSGRLAGLLFDRTFGLAAWMPGYLLLIPAGWALLRQRPAGWEALALPLAAGWATATWVALTMHGWWWPGRQVVVVLPCAVLAVAWWVARLRPARAVLAVAALVGAWTWMWLVVEAIRGDRTLIVDFYETADPVFGVWHRLLPDLWHPEPGDWVVLAVWAVALGAVAAVAARRGGPSPADGTRGDGVVDEILTTETRRSTHVPA